MEKPTFKRDEKNILWVATDWFCPSCGKQDMWQEGGGGGDYYHDSSVFCHSCGHEMCCVQAEEVPKEAR